MSNLTRLSLGVIVALAFTGCGDTTMHTDPAKLTVVGARPAHTVDLSSVLVTKIPTPFGSWLTAYKGSIWVKRDDGFVTRVDPETNRTTGKVGRFTDGDDYCQGIGSGGGAVWSCQRGVVTRIDPQDAKIVARIPVAKVFDQGHYAFAAGRLWLLTGKNGDELSGIDPATNRIGKPIHLPFGCSDLAPGSNVVWALCSLTGHVVKVDVAHGRVAGTAELPATYNGFATAADLWVGSGADLVRLDAETLRRRAVFRGSGPGMGGDVAVAGDRVWVSTNDGPLVEIDARANRVLTRVATPGLGGGGSIIAAEGALWNTAGVGSTGPLMRLKL